jgi:hypothetical protein
MNFMLFAYFGPETMLPLTSIVATVVGIFMMFGRTSIRIARRAFLSLLSGKGKTRPLTRPHFQVEKETQSNPEMSRS